MSVSRIKLSETAFAQAVMAQLQAIALRILPTGGAPGQVLRRVDNESAPYAWGKEQSVFVQQTRPTAPGPWVWLVTDENGASVDLIINNGEP